MNCRKLIVKILVCVLTIALSFLIFLFLVVPNVSYGFAREVSAEEAMLRQQLVQTAESWLGTVEGSPEHAAIIDQYNSHTPLAMGYRVTYTDSWCSTFVSAAAIGCDLTDIIPTECGCERHIGLFSDIGRWEENDNYLPLPGDCIFYTWDEYTLGDCTGWSDHVGIVVGTWGPFIKVIEGNKSDAVGYRYILRGDISIRGYGLPDYASKAH